MVFVQGRIAAAPVGCRVSLTVRSTWSRALPAMLIFGLVIGFGFVLLALQRGRGAVDPVLDLLVPMGSAIFTILVIFVPTLALLTVAYGGSQRRWLLAYLEGLLRA